MITVRPVRRANDVKPVSSSIEAITLDDLRSKPLIVALAYWNRLRGIRAFPRRDEITPRGMVPFLRNVVLARVMDSGRDYEYRIAGDAFVDAFGINFRGKFLSQVEAQESDYGHATRTIYEYVRNLGEPFALRGTIASSITNARFSHHETVFLPIGIDGVVDHLLVASVFARRPCDTAEMPVQAILPAAWKTYRAARAEDPA